MRIARSLLLASLILIFGAGAHGLTAQTAAPQPAPAQTASQASSLPAPSSEPAYTLPPGKLAAAKALDRIDLALEIVGTLWSLALLWILLAGRWAARLEAWLESCPDAWKARVLRLRWVQGLIFFALFLTLVSVAGMPLDAAGHAASLHYGISVQKWPGWLGDEGKGLLLSVLVGAPLLLLFNWLARVSPRRYWLWIWAVSLPLIVASVLVTPVVIDPLFNQFEPLTKHHAALAAELEKVVARTGTNIPTSRMFVMKASEKTNGINAYVTGIGATKRFVLWDTTINRMPDDEILFIFGHESGHYVLHHIPKILAITAAALFFVFWACAGFTAWLIRRFGARWGVESAGSRAGFLALIFAFSIAGFVLTPASNTMSRHFEHQADVYGQEAIHGLVPDPRKTAVSAFNHLGEAWLEDPDPNPLVEFWDDNHPSVQTRARFARSYNPWANGGHGKFFAK